MYAITPKRQKTLTKPNIYSEDMFTGTLNMKELLNNKMFSPMSLHLLYFKCRGGHITQCNTPKHRLLFCKQCNALVPKKECDRFTDNTNQFEQRKRQNSRKIRHNNKILYQFPESSRRYYPRKSKKKESVIE